MQQNNRSSTSENVTPNEPQSSNAPVKSVADTTFGAVPALEHPLGIREMRRIFEEAMVEAATGISRPEE